MRKKFIHSFILLFISLAISNVIIAKSKRPVPGLSLKQIKEIIDTSSGERALNHIRHLTLHHRWFVSDGYHEAALYIQRKAMEIGLEGVEIKKFPSDGKIFYSTSKSLPKWTVRSAELNLVSPIKKHLVSWEENPITLASNSRSANVTAELVDVGEGTHPSDYEAKDVNGRLVLASSPQGGGRIDLVHRLAVLERGAAGVISYRSYYLDDFPDLITWDHINTYKLNGKLSTFGFCISKRMGWELQRLLKKGERVVLQARVDADISEGDFEIVTGLIPGSDLAEQEIWFIAHLDHCLPSANDNASGSAAVLETARTFIDLIKNGILSKPRRTLRFFWVPEIWGTYAYIAKHLEETKRAIAVINMDMVGENQKLCGSVFRVTRTLASASSFFNDLLKLNLDFILSHNHQPGRELTDPFAILSPLGSRENWNAILIPFSGGSDHFVFMGGVINIPATMFGSWPDYFYHSSGDTPDKSDSTQLKRTIVYGTMVASSIMNLDTQSGSKLLDLIFPSCVERIDEAVDRAMRLLHESVLTGNDLKEALNILNWTTLWEQEILQSISKLLPGDKKIISITDKYNKEIRRILLSSKKIVHDYYGSLCKRKSKKISSVFMTEEEKSANQMIPVRNPAFPGPISNDYVGEKSKEKKLPYRNAFTRLQLCEIGAFINGKRSVLDIRNAVSAECGAVKLADVLSYLKILEKIDLVSFK